MLKTFINKIRQHIDSYPTPINLNSSWNFGFLSGVCLAIQIITGIFLTMHYTPHTDLAFNSVEHIMRDVNHGWYFRYAHANGATLFFICLYIHIGRGLYFRSYDFPRHHVWFTGIVIFLLTMATAFLGYVLPWGQMSFWGATVITNLFSSIPFVGQKLVVWLWGGFSVNNGTLNRFFALHFVLPFVILALVVLHLLLLHDEQGSSNPTTNENHIDNLKFFPYFFFKDLVSLIGLLFILTFLIHFKPNYFGHPDNYIEANPLVTPAHIVPEWYFLPFYAILRSVPDKLGGIVLMLLAILVLFIVPYLSGLTYIITPDSRFFFKKFFWFFVANFFLLGWIGGQPVEYPYVFIGQCSTFLYFFYFIVLIPSLERWENYVISRSMNSTNDFYVFARLNISAFIDKFIIKPFILAIKNTFKRKKRW